MQLIRYRDAWNEGWKYVSGSIEASYCICNCYDVISVGTSAVSNYVLTFQKEKTRDAFVITFKTLITQALPLL